MWAVGIQWRHTQGKLQGWIQGFLCLLGTGRIQVLWVPIPHRDNLYRMLCKKSMKNEKILKITRYDYVLQCIFLSILIENVYNNTKYSKIQTISSQNHRVIFLIVYDNRYKENLISANNSKIYNSTLTEVPCILYDSEGFTFKNFTNKAVFYAAILLGP